MDLPVQVRHLPARSEVVHAYCAHHELHRVFGHGPQTPLETGLARMARWVKAVRGPGDRGVRQHRGSEELPGGMAAPSGGVGTLSSLDPNESKTMNGPRHNPGREPRVLTVILNTNRRDDTLACLESLAASTYSNHRAIVLDNRSSDGSVAAIRAQHPDVEVLALDDNRGYAGNNNVGILKALDEGADWVLVLNEDTVVSPSCIAKMVAVGQKRSSVGIIGPLVYHHSEPTVIQSAGGLLGDDWGSSHIGQDEPDVGQFLEPQSVEWVSGCAIMIRAAAIRQSGLIDERYFYYWEETEWCLRMRRQRLGRGCRAGRQDLAQGRDRRQPAEALRNVLRRPKPLAYDAKASRADSRQDSRLGRAGSHGNKLDGQTSLAVDAPPS